MESDTFSADTRPEWEGEPGEVYRAIVLGLRDYAHKNAFRDAVLGLSGGIDSSLVAALATDALGAECVRGLAMPSPYSSPESVEDAVAVGERLGIRVDTVEIAKTFDAHRRALRPLFKGKKPDVTEENLQARDRGTLLMAVSNKIGSLVLATGNKSEYAVGYATLYGDMAGGFAPIKDVPKTLVYELCTWRNAEAQALGEEPPNPGAGDDEGSLRRAATRSKDSDTLPEYDVLDSIIEAYVEDGLGVDEIVERGIGDVRDRRASRDPDRSRRVQATAGGAGCEDHAESVRP